MRVTISIRPYRGVTRSPQALAVDAGGDSSHGAGGANASGRSTRFRPNLHTVSRETGGGVATAASIGLAPSTQSPFNPAPRQGLPVCGACRRLSGREPSKARTVE